VSGVRAARRSLCDAPAERRLARAGHQRRGARQREPGCAADGLLSARAAAAQAAGSWPARRCPGRVRVQAAQRAGGCRAGCGQLACQALPGEAAWPRVGAGLELLPVEAAGAAVVRGAAGMAVLALAGGRVSDAHLAPGAAAPPRRAAAPGRGRLAGWRTRPRVRGQTRCAWSACLGPASAPSPTLALRCVGSRLRGARRGGLELFVLAVMIAAARCGAARHVQKCTCGAQDLWSPGASHAWPAGRLSSAHRRSGGRAWQGRARLTPRRRARRRQRGRARAAAARRRRGARAGRRAARRRPLAAGGDRRGRQGGRGAEAAGGRPAGRAGGRRADACRRHRGGRGRGRRAVRRRGGHQARGPRGGVRAGPWVQGRAANLCGPPGGGGADWCGIAAAAHVRPAARRAPGGCGAEAPRNRCACRPGKPSAGARAAPTPRPGARAGRCWWAATPRWRWPRPTRRPAAAAARVGYPRRATQPPGRARRRWARLGRRCS